MFLLPFIQDIEVGHEEKSTDKNTENYIYLEKNEKILKTYSVMVKVQKFY